MLRENRANSTPIHTIGLQLLSRKNPHVNRGNMGNLRFFPGIDQVLIFAKEGLQALVGAASSGDKNAHIAAQNQAGQAMDAIVNSYNQIRSQGLLTIDHIDQAQASMREVIEDFKDFARQVGTARAQQGAQDVEYYGNITIRDMEADKSTLGYTPGIPTSSGGFTPSTGGGIALPTIQAVNQYLPLILAGAFLLFLPSIGKR